jgi:hypothetical protein
MFAAKWNIPRIEGKKTVYQSKPYKYMYRLEYLLMANAPFLDFSVPIPHSPFETWFRKNSKSLAKKKKNKWCELCNTYFEIVENHFQSIKHKQVATSDVAYAGVDKTISEEVSLECFIEAKRVKYNANGQFAFN